VVMDFLASTEVGKFPPKCSGGMVLAHGSGLRAQGSAAAMAVTGLYFFFSVFLASLIFPRGQG